MGVVRLESNGYLPQKISARLTPQPNEVRFLGRKFFTTEGTEDTEKTAARILQAFADFATVA
jgi:hypothetical protein